MSQEKTEKQIIDALSAPFMRKVGDKVYPALKWKPQNQAGDRYICVPYVDRDLVINRLNEVMGLSGWQFSVKREADGTKTGTMSLLIGGKWISRDDTGTQSREEGEKGSTSDALKRCATHFGIGTYIYGVPHKFVKAKLNHKNKSVPVDNAGRFLYGSSLSDFCNGMSTKQGYMAQLIVEFPELFQREDVKKLWNELKTL